jgi:Phospholipase_D-nuclease N-terminal
VDLTTHPFLDVMWTFFVIFVWLGWFILLIRIASDIFRRHDIGGGAKAVWVIFVVLLPFLGSLVYLIKEGSHLGRRDMEEAKALQAQMDARIIQAAGADGASAAAEIARAKSLLDAGTINQAEFEKVKSRVMLT